MSAVCSSGDGSSAPPLFAKNYVGGGVREARDVLALYSLLFGGQTDQQQLPIPGEKKAAVNKELFAQVLLLLERSHRLSQRNNNQEEEDGFVLVTAHSGIEGAGTGVFLHKANHNSRGESEEKKVLRRGQLCCFYAGVVYSPVDMIAVYPHIYIDNHYLITRHDEVLIDGRATGISKTVFQNLWSRERRPTQQMKKEETREQADKEEALDFVTLFGNPWAVAQLVNHPPAGKRPNVMCYALDWYLQEQEEQMNEAEVMPMIPLHLQPHLPCLPFRQVRDERNGKRVLKGMVLVATRDIEEGEELLLDYHLNPKSESLPQWYHPVMPVATPNEEGHEEEEEEEESQPHNAATTITKGRDA
ncbi:SET domain-containing protein 9 [Balamuthia mandrillaris]